jgi:hypothetical protein
MSTYAALVGTSSQLNLPHASTEYSSQYGRTPSPERPLNSGGEEESSSEPSAKSSIEMEKSEMHSMDAEQKKGWRFFGTFACLAVLNFVCAIDATILSVALPVRSFGCSLFSFFFPVVMTETDSRCNRQSQQTFMLQPFRLSGVELRSSYALLSFNQVGLHSLTYLVANRCS